MRSPRPQPSVHVFCVAATVWLALVGLSVRADVPKSSWPTAQGSPHRNAWTQTPLPVSRLQQAWVWESPTPPQTAWHGPAKWDAYAGIRGLHSMRNYDPVFHPISVGDSVWFASSGDDCVRRMDAHSGREHWRFVTGGPVRVAPSYWEGKLYFGSDDGWAYCLDANSGELLWKHSPSPGATKLLHNGRLISRWPIRTGVTVLEGAAYYAASLFPWEPSYLVALDAMDGRVSKEGHFVREIANATFEGPMVVSPERLVAPQGRVAPLLFDRANGNPQGALKGGGGSFVVLTPDSQIIHGPGNKTGWLTASKPLTREAIATFKQGNAIVVAGDWSFMLTDDQLIASDWVRRKPRWQADCANSFGILVAGDHVVVGGRDEVRIYEASSGALAKILPAEGRIYGLAAAGNRLVLASDTGKVSVFAAGVPGSPPTQTPADKTAASDAKDAESKPEPPREHLKPVEPFSHPALRHRWVFQRPHASQRQVQDLAGALDGSVRSPSRFTEHRDQNGGTREAWELDGQTTVVIRDDFRKANLPVRELTVEAWVRVDKPLTWGGILGAIQDNGSYERGWLLGFRDKRFSFAVSSESAKKLTYLAEPADREMGRWAHVAGVYDGQRMRLLVDGKRVAESVEQNGDILYPPNTIFELGAYHDDNEFYRTEGAIHEIRLYDRALPDEEIAKHANSLQLASFEAAELAFGPILRFLDPTRAQVVWRTRTPSPTRLRVEGRELQEVAGERLDHEMIIPRLRKRDLVKFEIEFTHNGRTTRSQPFECDNFFNYSQPTLKPLPKPLQADDDDADFRREVRQLLPPSQSLGVVLRPTKRQLQSLLSLSGSRWIAFHDDPEFVDQIRQWLVDLGRYGGQCTVFAESSLQDLPATSAFADLVIYPSEERSLEAEAKRLTRPQGATATYSPAAHTTKAVWRRPAIEGAGSWTHLYGDANNSAFGGETLSGVNRAEDLDVQWIGRPGPRYQPDRSGRKPSPLAGNGRLFLQGLERLIALNSFNGLVLWSLEIPKMGRFNMPRDCSNWCIDEDRVYVAVGETLLVLDAATGKIVHDWDVNQLAESVSRDAHSASAGPYDWGFIARGQEVVLGSAVRKGTVFTDYWGNANQGWYDAKSGEATYKVCSDELFAVDPDNGKRLWSRTALIVNPTITIAGDRVYFTESRNRMVIESPSRRVGPALSQNLHLVCLDLSSGKLLWEKPVESFDSEVVGYLAFSNDRLTLVGSAKGSYETRVLDADTGKDLWRKKTPWPQDHHGGHMSRPAIVGDVLYVRPQAFELETGLTLSLKMPGGGCGTYAATSEMLIFRSRNVTLWDRKEGGASFWNRLRPDCWISTIPADGLVLSPEGGGGCSCGSWMEASLGFLPKSLGRPNAEGGESSPGQPK